MNNPKPGKPLWRSVVDGIDRTITPPANQLVRTNAFTDVVAALTRLEVRVRRRAERESARTWHFLNLPAASDVRRLRAQIAALEGRVRDVSERMEDRDREE